MPLRIVQFLFWLSRVHGQGNNERSPCPFLVIEEAAYEL